MTDSTARINYPVACSNADCIATLYGPVAYCPYCGKSQAPVVIAHDPPEPISTEEITDAIRTPSAEPDADAGVPMDPAPARDEVIKSVLPSRPILAEASPPVAEKVARKPMGLIGAMVVVLLLVGGLALFLNGREETVNPPDGAGSTEQGSTDVKSLPPTKPPPEPPKPPEPPPKAQVPRPEIHVGDTYTYESINHTNPKLTNTTERTVVSIDGDTVYVRSTNTKGGHIRHTYFDRSWNFQGSQSDSGDGASYSPALKYFDFPLYEGKTWSAQSTETNRKSGATRLHEVEGRVLGQERIQVPMGSFDAWKVELRTRMRDGTKLVDGVDTSWYVPELKRSVKSEMSSREVAGGSEERKTILLVSYRLADSSHAPASPNVTEQRYAPTAEEIAEQLLSALAGEGLRGVKPIVGQDLAVVLEGRACTEAEARKAESVARSMSMVKNVRTELLVHSRRVAQVQRILYNKGLSDIRITTQPDCMGIAVTGAVTSESEREQALLQVSLYADGLPVTDQLRLDQPRANLPRGRIDPPRCGSVATLEGAVQRGLRGAGFGSLSAEVDDACVVKLKGTLTCANDTACDALKREAITVARGFADVRRVDEMIFMVFDE